MIQRGRGGNYEFKKLYLNNLVATVSCCVAVIHYFCAMHPLAWLVGIEIIKEITKDSNCDCAVAP